MPFPFLHALSPYLFLNNNAEGWAAAAAVFLLGSGAMVLVRTLVLRRLRARLAAAGRRRTDGLGAAILAQTYTGFLLAFGLYLGSTMLDLSHKQDLFVSRIAIAALLLQGAIWGDTGLRAWGSRYRFRPPPDGARRAPSNVVTFLLRMVLWAVAILMLIDNFGINITALVASLGIGGVAVALATQNILGDLFASLSIMLDKPFEVGDFIIVGEVLGSVEHIGLKTTRVRGLGGEQVVFSNGDLLKSRIHNHKRMETRRVAFILRIAYGTAEDVLCRLPQTIREVITARSDVEFERAHFFNWGEWSLDFEVVYHFQSPDYILHMDAQQDIFLRLYRRFAQEGIEFAHPLSIVRLADQGLANAARGARPAPPPGPAFH
jgi:small-conductance mechanosensitive channel